MSKYYVYNGRLYSEEELRHHGILGMKWGVRRYQNKDGSLTAEGKQRVRERASEEALKMYNGHAKVASAKDKLLAADKLGEEFFGDEDLMVEYKKKAIKAYNKEWGWELTDEFIDSMDASTDFLWDDWDQGEGNSFQLFVKDRGVDEKAYVRNYMNAEKEYRTACRDATMELLDSIEGSSMRNYGASNKDISAEVDRVLYQLMEDEQMRRNMFGYYYLC